MIVARLFMVILPCERALRGRITISKRAVVLRKGEKRAQGGLAKRSLRFQLKRSPHDASSPSQFLQIFDQRPTLRFTQVGAIRVSGVAVAIGVQRIDCEVALLERRFIGTEANIVLIEQAAADLERGLAVLWRREQFPQVGNRTVVRIWRRRPDTVQHARFVGAFTGRGGLAEKPAEIFLHKPTELQKIGIAELKLLEVERDRLLQSRISFQHSVQ